MNEDDLIELCEEEGWSGKKDTQTEMWTLWLDDHITYIQDQNLYLWTKDMLKQVMGMSFGAVNTQNRKSQ